MGNNFRIRRTFSESLKRKLVKELELGKVRVKEVSEIYEVSESAVYVWLNKYSEIYQRRNQVIVEEQSESKKARQLEQRIKDLEQKLGQKQMRLEYLEKMLELHKESTGEDLEKKHG
jgi:transposase